MRGTYLPASSELFDGTGPAPACGPVSMAIAFQILRVNIVDSELATLADANGTSTFQTLADYARGKGLHVRAVQLEAEQLLALRHVAILQVRAPAAGSRRHFLVFAGPADANHVYLFDGAAAHRRQGPVLLDRFAEDFTGRALILSKYPIRLATTDRPAPGAGAWSAWSSAALALGALLLVIGLAALWRRRAHAAGLAMRGRTLALLAGCVVLAVTDPAAVAGFAPTIAGPDPLPAQSDQAAESRYVVGPLTYSAGAVSLGTKIRHEFDIRNPDAQPLNIRLGPTTCSCLGATLMGPATLPPGGRTKVAVEVLAVRGGLTTQGVTLHLSAAAAPLRLAIRATVMNDTTVTPPALDFGEIPRTAGPESRPLRLVHHADQAHPFTILQASLDVPFLRVAGLPEPTVTETGDGVMKHEFPLRVVLDPPAAPLGRFAARLVITARKGDTPLQFDIPCTGHILPRVATKPSQIIKLLKPGADQFRISLRLTEADRRRIAVCSVESDAVAITGWTQQYDPAAAVTNLTLDAKPILQSGRAQGTCRIKLTEPPGETVDIPVLVVQTNETIQKGRVRPESGGS